MFGCHRHCVLLYHLSRCVFITQKRIKKRRKPVPPQQGYLVYSDKRLCRFCLFSSVLTVDYRRLRLQELHTVFLGPNAADARRGNDHSLLLLSRKDANANGRIILFRADLHVFCMTRVGYAKQQPQRVRVNLARAGSVNKNESLQGGKKRKAPRKRCFFIPSGILFGLFLPLPRDRGADHKDRQIDRDRDQGDYGIGQKGKSLKGRMDQEHGIDVACHLPRGERAKHQVAVAPDRAHSHNGKENTPHISLHVRLDVPKKRKQQHVEQKRGVRGDALDVLIIGKRWIADKIHVGEHPHQRGHDAKPKQIIRKKNARPRRFVRQKCKDQGAPHHHVARIDGQKQVGRYAEVFHRAVTCEKLI